MTPPDTTDAVVLFDGQASAWEARYDTSFFRDRLRVYDRWLSARAPERLASGACQALDIGCATFPAAATYARHGVSAIGVDVAENMVTIAKQLNRSAVHFNGVDLPFPSGTFSLITMINTFEFVARPADLWAEILRVSTPDVAMLMTINNFNSWVKRVLRRVLSDPYVGRSKAWHSSYSMASLADLIVPMGFRAPVFYAYSLPTLYERAPFVLQWPMFRNRVWAENIYLDVTRRPR